MFKRSDISLFFNHANTLRGLEKKRFLCAQITLCAALVEDAVRISRIRTEHRAFLISRGEDFNHVEINAVTDKDDFLVPSRMVYELSGELELITRHSPIPEVFASCLRMKSFAQNFVSLFYTPDLDTQTNAGLVVGEEYLVQILDDLVDSCADVRKSIAVIDLTDK